MLIKFKGFNMQRSCIFGAAPPPFFPQTLGPIVGVQEQTQAIYRFQHFDHVIWEFRSPPVILYDNLYPLWLSPADQILITLDDDLKDIIRHIVWPPGVNPHLG